ncbi:MAG: hypothetical protein LKI94_03155 [Sporolactobacillus sp.]|jgi:hypothetical protein|nr:hypothetical protein [Sporolactobacillus sp.]
MKKRDKSDVVIRFNGKALPLDEWSKKEAAADREPKRRPVAAPQRERLPDRPVEKGRIPRFASSKPPRPMLRRRLKKVAMLFWLPGVAAVIVGLAIGLSMLTSISGAGQAWSGSSPATSDAETTPVEEVKAEDLSLSLYVLQAGVFAKRERALQVARSFRKAGYAALTAGTNPTAVMVGASETQSGVKRFSQYFAGRHISVYTKELRIRADQKTALKSGRRATRLLNGKRFVETLLGLSEASIAGKTLPRQEIERLKKLAPNVNRGETDALARFETAASATLNQVPSATRRPDEAAAQALRQSALELIALYQQAVGDSG